MGELAQINSVESLVDMVLDTPPAMDGFALTTSEHLIAPQMIKPTTGD